MYFDLQVNGYAGVDFQKPDLNADELHRACAKLRDDGVDGILATIITEDVGRMCASLARIVELRERDPLIRQIIAGFHVEGPFINETDGYRGAHPRDAVRPGDPEIARRLVDAAGGLVRVFTLAPERDPAFRVTRLLSSMGIIVSAGHCNPTMSELNAAINAGLSMCTHLGNGCPLLLHRHDNVIQRVLSLRERLWICFIADGAHVPFYVLRNYLRCVDLDRTVVVTDAIAPAGLGPGRYTLGRWDLVVGANMVAMAPDGSHLIGSACTMRQAQANLVDHVGLSPQQAQKLLCENPARAVDCRR